MLIILLLITYHLKCSIIYVTILIYYISYIRVLFISVLYKVCKYDVIVDY